MGELICVSSGKTMYIGRLKMIRANTRGNLTLGLVNTTILSRSGNMRRGKKVALWTLREAKDFDWMPWLVPRPVIDASPMAEYWRGRGTE